MTPEQAIELLDQAAQAVTGTRKDHMMLMQAVATLKQFIVEHSEKKPETVEK